MKREEFFEGLRQKLKGLPQKDIESRLDFYREMIDDRMDEGISEEEAIAALGSSDEIAAQIIAEIPLTRIVKEKIKPKRRFEVWEIVLIVLGAPIWISLIAAVFSVVVSLYATIWSVAVVSAWAVFASFSGCAVGGVVGGILFIFSGTPLVGVAVLGGGIACAGLAVLSFFGCREATKGAVWVTKKMALGIKRCFVGKERV